MTEVLKRLKEYLVSLHNSTLVQNDLQIAVNIGPLEKILSAENFQSKVETLKNIEAIIDQHAISPSIYSSKSTVKSSSLFILI